jgi:uncharacterized repeat protein (TIGR01451 family)
MNKILLLFLTISLGLLTHNSLAQVLRPFTPRFTAPSEKGNIRYISNNISYTYGANRDQIPPAGGAQNNGGHAVFINVDGMPNNLISYGDNWKYWDQGTRPASWQTTAFNDAGWAAGLGQLGYGDGDEATVVSFGGAPGNKHITTYFRKNITINNLAQIADFTMGVKRDDGIVVYINGVERYRNNMPTGVVNNNTLATIAAPDDGDVEQLVTLSAGFFIAGTNTIAVEIHQNAQGSSDISFDMRLVGNPTPNTTIIPFNSSWKYWDQGSTPASWESTGFNDVAWASGNGQLGYGDGDETTVIGFGGNASNKYITSYFRKVVTIANPTVFTNLIMSVKRDDGIVIYINGIERYRDNMPGGPITFGTLSTSLASDDGAGEHIVSLPSSYFVNGANTIAVEVHQNDPASSDLSFDLKLDGNYKNSNDIIPFGSNWRYWDQGTRSVGWANNGFDASSWATGNAHLGYGDGDETTTVGYGGDVNNKFITTYFRKEVYIDNPGQYGKFIFNLKRDDGAVVYVNGVPILYNNLDQNAVVDNTTFANSDIVGAAENEIIQYEISSGYFVNGLNTIAVEIHQNSITSDDISFDLEVTAFTGEIFNSSRANLSIPACSEVIFAGIYWGASLGHVNDEYWRIPKKDTVKLKLPGSSTYQNIVSQVTDIHNFGIPDPGQNHVGYQNFADITNMINTLNPNGTYSVGNIIVPTGFSNSAAGWTIVIAYKNSSEIVRNLVVFDGMAQVGGNSSLSLDIPFGGFKTPAAGPVSCQLGVICYDGDRGNADGFFFKQDSTAGVGTYYDMTTAPAPTTSGVNDAWNSSISYLGNNVTTRFPAYANTHGYDADIVDVPNVGNANLGNNATSARIRLTSAGEKYFLQVVTTATATRDPLIQIQKSSTDVNGGILIGGEELRYNLNFVNNGNDSSVNTIIFDTIPLATSYKPNSLMINGVPKTDAIGDDEAEYDYISNRVVYRVGTAATNTNGGSLLVGATGQVQFSVYTSTSCTIRSCSNPVSNIAWVTYTGPSTNFTQTDQSVRDVAGCLVNGGVTNLVNGPCRVSRDTTISNSCPVTTALIPVNDYIGYRFYRALPFNTSNIINPYTPITSTSLIYGFFDGPGNCNDTININIFIQRCPDIDDDNDGLPDYVEINVAAALADDDADGTPNWNDAQYTGYVDHNIDGFNDNFDPSADSDNDGIVNFLDINFAGFVDINGDGVNDMMDKDLDGIPNHLDLDSDNDGIPDTVESFGVDADGDGRIDNYTDTDNDGFSQNVDADNAGVTNSSIGLGALNTDGDALPNYLDLDSDNDGIPDIVEAFGVDVNNNGKIDVNIDTDIDGYADQIDGDVGNDLIAENSAAAILRTGADANNNGKTDSWPNKNMDRDSKPSPYDLDSDDDGIDDVIEAQFSDTDFNGRIDGALNSDQWSIAIAALANLTLPNTDNNGNINVYDIDSDDDGIPDNIEGLPTTVYVLPVATDTDGDGINDSYDNFNGFGGNGINPFDRDADTVPDYLDLDTDSDGQIDIIEGNDFNLDGIANDVFVTGLDSDGDGLDDFFDADNSSCKGTSAFMGNAGATSGDASPGSLTSVQRTMQAFGGCSFERDWRCMTSILNCNYVKFTGLLKNSTTKLDWTVVCEQQIKEFVIERSVDGTHFIGVATIAGKPGINVQQQYTTTDNVSGITVEKIYYRLKTTGKNGKTNYSNIITVFNKNDKGLFVEVYPMPIKTVLNMMINSTSNTKATIEILSSKGAKMFVSDVKLQIGNNYFSNIDLPTLSNGVYVLLIKIGEQIITKKIRIDN